jgi:hypothetical protein
VLRHSGRGVAQDYLGSPNQSPGWIGDQAADAAPASLAKRDRTGAEEKNTDGKQMPHSPASILPIHEQPPKLKVPTQCSVPEA